MTHGFSAALKRVELFCATGVLMLGMGAGARFGEPRAKHAVARSRQP